MTFMSWQEGLDLPGASQIGWLKKLMESYPMKHLVPDQSLLTGAPTDCASYTCAIRGKSHAFVYIPTGNKTTVQMGILSGEKVKASWFNPRDGQITPIGQYPNKGTQSFEVPGMSKELGWLKSGRGCDWVLILEDAAIR